MMETFENSTATISGSDTFMVRTLDNSTLTVDGGAIVSLYTYDNSTVIVSGGLISQGILSSYESQVTFLGTDFAVNGTPVDYGTLTSILGGPYDNEPSRTLTGTLANGDPLGISFHLGEDSSIVLTPEPATLLLLGLGAVMLRRRRL